MAKILLALILAMACRLAAQPVITQQPANQTIVYGGSATFNVAASGTGLFTYQWQFNGTNLPNNIITTVAGTNTFGFSGDGGPAVNAALRLLTGVTADISGNFYIVDQANNRIRKVNINGIIMTVAGTNSAGFSGDGGAANLASLSGPYGLNMDVLGNYFIADTGNNRIRKVDTNGIITTVAGNGGAGFSGEGGFSTNAAINSPRGVATDGYGNIFIADSSNNRIRKVDTNGIISTVAGTGTSGYSGDGGAATNAKLAAPQGLAVDGNGNLIIADSSNNRVRRVDTNGVITTIAGTNTASYSGDGGVASLARLSFPCGVTIDPFGYLFIADSSNHRIRQIDPNGIITTVVGNGSTSLSGDGGPATNASLNQPFGTAIEASGTLLIADQAHYRVRRATLGRIPILQFNSVATNNAGNYQVIITSPSGRATSDVVTLSVAFQPSIVTQPQSTVISNGYSGSFSVTAAGTSPLGYQWYINTNAVDGETNATLNFPGAVASQAGNYSCVIANPYGAVTSSIAILTVLTPPSITTQPTNQTVAYGNSVMLSVTVFGSGPLTYQWLQNGTNVFTNGIITTLAGGASGGFSGDGNKATNARLSSPYGITSDSTGNVYIADTSNQRIRKIDTNDIISTIAGNGALGFSGDGGAATNASFNNPYGLAADVSGNIFIADRNNYRIRKVDTNSIITTVAGTGSPGFSGDGGNATNAKLGAVSGVTVDPSGNLFIADSGTHRIRKVSTNGIISTVAGKGVVGNTGDGGVATNAALYAPFGVTLDISGNLLISSTYAIRKVTVDGIISTVAGTGTGGFSGDGGPATNATMWNAQGIFVDKNGFIYMADSTSYRIRQVDGKGIITTFAGNGSSVPLGDGGYATNAGLWVPYGVAQDDSGNLLITDSQNNRIRTVFTGRGPTLKLKNATAAAAGNYQVIITSPYGSVTSSIVSLNVLLPPSITSQPSSMGVTNGSMVNLNVSVTNNPPFNYQWFISSGRAATADSYISGGHVQYAFVNDPGAGYVSTPQVRFVGGGGSGATAAASILFGTVFNINVLFSGSGYTTPPIVQIDPPPTINTALAGETNATLSLPSATSANSTNYFVVVTNNFGGVTSVTAWLRVFLPPQNFTIQNLGMGFQFNLTGTPNYLYILQSATNLTPPINWQPVVYKNSDTNGNWQYNDTSLNAVQKFYRVSVQ